MAACVQSRFRSLIQGKARHDAAFADGIAAAVAGLALLLAAPAGAQTLRMVAHSDLKVLDPIWTTAFITRNHGYMIYDTLFAKDEELQHPAADGRQVRDLGRQAHLDLHPARRPGVARRHSRSPRRTASPRSSAGARATRSASSSWPRSASMKAVDAKTFTIVLKEPFGLVLEALGKPSSNVPFMMPKRVAETDPIQADRRLHRLRPVHLQEGRMEARREDRLRQEHQVQAARRAALDAGRRQGGQGRPRRMDRHHRPADRGQCAAAGRDRPDRGAGARPLPDAQGRQEHRAVRLERARQPDHHALQPPPSAVQQS